MSITIFQGDCISHLAQMADKTVDHFIMDPPYDQKTHSGALIQHNGAEMGIDFEHLVNVTDLVYHALRIARRWVIAFCSLEQLAEYRNASGDCWVRAGVWVRHSGPQKTGDRPGQAAEGVAIMHAPHEGKMKWNGGGKAGKWEDPIVFGVKLHPTQKPLPLMESLVRDFTDYGDTILDPYMGSGTTGVAAAQLGRNFIGIERDEKYFKIAQRRLALCREQLTIFLSPPKRQKKSKPKQLTMEIAK
jgi:site-specific DNA-methyltransferase (adenine-specific)